MVGRLLQLLDSRGRRQAVLLALLSVVSAALELGAAASMVAFMSAAARPDLLSRIPYYQYLGQPSLSSLMIGLGVLCLVTLSSSNLLMSLCNLLSLKFSHEQQLRLSTRLFCLYLNQPYEWHLRRHPSQLVYHLGQARQLAPQGFLPLLQIVSRSFGILVLVGALLKLRPLVTTIGLLTLAAIYTGVFRFCRKRSLATYAVEWEIEQSMGRTIGEPMVGLRDVRLAASESSYERSYAEQLGQIAEQQRTRLFYSEAPRLFLQTLVYSVLLGSVVLLAILYEDGAKVVAEATFYAIIAYRLLPLVQQVLSSLSQLEHGETIERMLREELKASIATLPQPSQSAQPLDREWSLREVDFSYDDKSPLFRNLNLTIPRGACVGIVGPSGHGKTTLINLLIGLLTPQRGELLADGRPLEGSELRAFWTTVGYVPQDIFLTDHSLLHNITLGLPLDHDRVREVARLSRLDEFAETLPQGYETKIGDRGSRLSGGQRQRLGIARALYRRPSILVLDEATSALDRGLEADVIATIRSLAGTHTILMVCHQRASLSCCDRIYRVEKGEIFPEDELEPTT